MTTGRLPLNTMPKKMVTDMANIRNSTVCTHSRDEMKVSENAHQSNYDIKLHLEAIHSFDFVIRHMALGHEIKPSNSEPQLQRCIQETQ
jgi:hypothetical protein